MVSQHSAKKFAKPTLETVKDQNPENVQESDAADSVEAPSSSLSRGPSRRDKAGKQTSDNHKHIREDEQDSLIRCQARQEAEGHEQEWSGE